MFGNQQDPTRLLLKCAHFFKSLSRLNSTKEQHQHVLQLLREGVLSEMSAEELIAKLREVTGSQDKGTLLPFLKLSLPLLRVSFRNGEQPELQQMLCLSATGNGSPEDTALPSPQQLQQSDGGLDETIAAQRQQQISRSVPPPSLQQNQTHNHTTQNVNIVRPLSVQNSLNAPCPATTFIVHRKPSSSQQQYSLSKQMFPADNEASPAQQVQAVAQQLTQHPSMSLSTLVSTNDFESNAPSTTTAHAQIAPESLQNLPPMLLNPQALADRILTHMPDARGVDAEVLSIISMAAETRLRTVLTQLAALADHRQRPLRIDPYYALVDEPRKQMRFMEDIERRAYENRETAEKEAMMRTAKSKGGKDREAVEKAKMSLKADREAIVNREANLAALAALGDTKTGGPMKRQFGAPTGPGGIDWKIGMQNQGTSGGLIKNRPPVVRLKRVTMRDLQYFLCNDPLVPRSSRLRYRIALSTLSVDENNSTNI